MIDHQAIQLAMRTELADLEVVYTAPVFGDVEWSIQGSYSVITMGVTAGKYTRGTGSFLTDGFKAGMEITVSGFTTAGNNGTSVVSAVTALALTVDRTLTTETAATGRSAIVYAPTGFATENIPYTPVVGAPWFEEQLLAGPTRQITFGEFGVIEHDPIYVIQVHVPEGVGIGAPNAYADGLIKLFPPRTALSLSNGDTARVRTQPGPFRSQLRQFRTGYATVSVTVPLRIHTANSI